jgi:hypothetical protein
MNKAADFPIQVNNSIYSCYYSVSEIKTIQALYRSSLTNFQAIKFNMFFNGGMIMKGVEQIFLYNNFREYSRIDSDFTYGTEVGQIIFSLLFPYEVALNNALDRIQLDLNNGIE